MNKWQLKHLENHRDHGRIGMYLVDMGLESIKSPLHAVHQKLGAEFIEFGGWVWVDQYKNNMIEEYRQLNQGVVVCDIFGVGFGLIKGKDVLLKLIPHITNKNVINRSPGMISYTGFITSDGRFFDDGMVLIVSDSEVYITINETFVSFIEMLGKEALLGLSAIDLTFNYSKLQVQGPQAETVVNKLMGLDSMKLFHFAVKDDVIVAKCGFTLPGGYELFVPVKKGEYYWTQLMQEGALPYGIKAMEISRVESVKIRSGYDFFPFFHRPEELAFAVDYVDPKLSETYLCYFISDRIGDTYKEQPVIGNLIKDLQGEICGFVSSGVYGGAYDRYLGFCHLFPGQFHEGMSLYVGDTCISICEWANAKKILKNIDQGEKTTYNATSHIPR